MSGETVAGSSDRCQTCDKKVYPMEKLLVDGKSYHRACFRCSVCLATLKPSQYNSDRGVLYCRHHYQQRGDASKAPAAPAAASTTPASTTPASPAGSAPSSAPGTPEINGRSSDEPRRKHHHERHRDRETSKRDLKDDAKKDRKRERSTPDIVRNTTRGASSPLATPTSGSTIDNIGTLATAIEHLMKESKRTEDEIKSLKSDLKKSKQNNKKATEKYEADIEALKTQHASEVEELRKELVKFQTRLEKVESILAPAPTPVKEGGQKKAVRFTEESKAGKDTVEEDSAIKEYYKFKRKLGKGATAIVYEAKSKKSGQKVAVKKIKKAHITDEDALWRELSIVKNLHHPNVVEFYEHFEDSDNYYLVMELVEGKELFEKILDKGLYSEAEAVHIVKQLVSAIQYLHDQGIAHRDLKPENLLSSGDGEREVVKVTDFGLSKCFKEGPLKTMCGSSVYISPEVVEGQPYDKSVDMWSLGVIVYILLCGYPPWKNPPERATQLIKEIIQCQYTFHEEDWREISSEAKDFIQHLLVKDPKQRYTALQAAQHPWLAKTFEKGSSNANLERSVSRLKIYLRGEGVPEEWEVEWRDVSPLLKEPIAEGAFAFVYKVQWKGKPVAVKKIKFEKDETDEEEVATDFKKEVEVMSKLRHENIVQFVAATTHFPNLCIITEFYNKGSLNDLLHKKSIEFDWALKIKMCLQVARGLNYLHTRNPKIIHRDVKAENVFIDDDWTAKLGDFGLSKIKTNSTNVFRRIESARAIGKMYSTPLESRIDISTSGTVGTPAWIAPEILDMKPYSERADVYSYGVFLWEVLTRKLPHSDKGDYSIAMGVLTQDERPEIPADCPAKFAKLMNDTWAPRSEDRMATEQIIQYIEALGFDEKNWR